jgi:enoyl-CoA hydratase
MSEPEVIVRREGAWGRLTLNRPKALNALTRGMCETISEALLEWERDPGVEAVLIDHAGERGFCAGGDIRLVRESGIGDGQAARAFFAAEYRMNELMFRYRKPLVVVMDGVTMGGGVGVSAPCRYRIATERTLWAMPEGDIGLYPDVGAGWYLARLPEGVGNWLALTGARLRAADCVRLGIATHFVESGRVEELKAALLSTARSREGGNPGFLSQGVVGAEKNLDPRLRGDERIDEMLGERASQAAETPVESQLPDIARLFTAPTAEEVVRALEEDGGDWARAQLEALSRKCPMTVKVSLRLIEAGAKRTSFADEMAAEYRVSARMIHRHDFIEGVRAVLLDKDGSPRWDPAALEDVTEDMVDAVFAELPPDEEWTPFADRP